MGDRTSVRVEVWHEDVIKFVEILDPVMLCEDSRGLKSWLLFEDDEVNYAGWSELQAAAQEGCRFHGSHGSGGDYDAREFCSDGEGFYNLPINDSGGYSIPVTIDPGWQNPRVEFDTLMALQKFCQVMRDLLAMK